MKNLKMVQTGSQTVFPVGGGGAKLSRSKAFDLFKSLKTFICNLFKGGLSGVNRGESCQFTRNSSLSTVHSLAFTLAETLIVMGIIGVVAALTIPNVNKNTGEAEKVARFKKIYAELNEALDRATAVYGPVKTWWQPTHLTSYDYAKKFTDRLTEFMKVTKFCKAEDENCFCYNRIYDDSSCFILASGAGIGYDFDNDYIYIDTDGPNRGKNEWGIDLFLIGFSLDNNYILKPLIDSTKEEFMRDMDGWWHGHCSSACGQWIMDNGNMDYLNIDSQGRCKNDTSKVLGYGEGKVQSCK
ncbi:type II secretion system protein [bacterium]|nr:type II secretion system protein [bacterium]